MINNLNDGHNSDNGAFILTVICNDEETSSQPPDTVVSVNAP